MTIRQLEYFLAVAEEKSISAAARALHVAQPPISRQIAQLEDELGVCLFVRESRGMKLTEAGRSLLRQGRQLFSTLRRVEENVKSVGAGEGGRINAGVIYSAMPYALRYFEQFHARYPKVEFYIRLGSPQDLLADLDRGALHVLFLRRPTQERLGLHEKLLGEDELALIMTEQTDPAPELPAVPIERLRGVAMCLLRSDDLWGYNDYLLGECRRSGFEPNVPCQCYDTPMAMQLVRSGFGVSFLPRSIVETHPNSGIYAKPLMGLPAKSYPILVWSDEALGTPCVRRFTEEAPAAGRRT